MLFPKNRMRFVTSYQGKSEAEGWIVLDIAGVELEGVTRIYLSGTDIEKLKQGGDVAADRLRKARSLLGAENDNEAEER